MVLRNVARGMVCGAEGGKKRATSVAVAGSPAQEMEALESYRVVQVVSYQAYLTGSAYRQHPPC